MICNPTFSSSADFLLVYSLFWKAADGKPVCDFTNQKVTLAAKMGKPFPQYITNGPSLGQCFLTLSDIVVKERIFYGQANRKRPLGIIICKMPVPPDDHWQPRKGHEKCIFETLHNEMQCVLSNKESNFNGEK